MYININCSHWIANKAEFEKWCQLFWKICHATRRIGQPVVFRLKYKLLDCQLLAFKRLAYVSDTRFSVVLTFERLVIFPGKWICQGFGVCRYSKWTWFSQAGNSPLPKPYLWSPRGWNIYGGVFEILIVLEVYLMCFAFLVL